MNPNEDIIETLRQYLRTAAEPSEFQQNLIKNAITRLSGLPRRVTSGEQAVKTYSIPRVAARLIDRYCKEGKLEEVEQMLANQKKQKVSEIMKYFSVNEERATQLYETGTRYNMDLPSFYNLLTTVEQIAFSLRDELNVPVKEDEVHRAAKLVEQIAKQETGSGSVVANEEETRRIEVALLHPNFKPGSRNCLPQIVVALKKKGFVKHEMNWMQDKCVFQGICKEALWHRGTLEGGDRGGQVTNIHHWIVIHIREQQ